MTTRRPDPLLHAAELSRRAADLAHDLASPMQLASGYLSMLEHGRDLDGGAAALARRAIDRASALLPRLTATVVAGSPPNPVVLDPGRVLQDVLEVVGRHGRGGPEVVICGLGSCRVLADVAQLSCAFELLATERRPTCLEAGPAAGGGWQLDASGMGPEAGEVPLWELIVERQGGARRPASGLDPVTAARLWLPASERCDEG